MRLGMRRWIAAAGLVACAISGAGAATTPAGQQEPVTVNTLSGAYLAARIAESDNDLDAAIAYYRRALAFDPDNLTVQQSLLLGLISQGKFDEALPFAEKLKETPEVERFSRLALGTDAIRHGRYADAEYWLKLSLESDLDRLITGLMAAWAKLGDGISDDMVAGKPGFAHAWSEIEAFRDGRVIVGHSIGFDLAGLEREAALAGLEWEPPRGLCIRMLAQVANPNLPDQSLDTIANWLEIVVEGRHTALGDAQAAAI